MGGGWISAPWCVEAQRRDPKGARLWRNEMISVYVHYFERGPNFLKLALCVCVCNRKCLMPPWRTENWVLNLPQAQPCSFTGSWGWSTSLLCLVHSLTAWGESTCPPFCPKHSNNAHRQGRQSGMFVRLKSILLLFFCYFCNIQVLRPGVLWFLRNLNDPDFNPVQEMIHLPIYRHLRRFILSVVSAGSLWILKKS